MCYIGIDSEIEEINHNKNKQSICIKKIGKEIFEENTFTSRNINNIGTREGCGCSFGYTKIPSEVICQVRTYFPKTNKIEEKHSEYFEFEDSIELIEKTINRNAAFSEDTNKLYSIIFHESKINQKVEFFACWSGLENKAPDEVIFQSITDCQIYIPFEKIWDANIKIDFVHTSITSAPIAGTSF